MAKIKIVGDSREAHDLLHKHDIHHHGDLEEVDGVIVGGQMDEFQTNASPQAIKDMLREELPETKVMVKGFWGWYEVK